MTFITILENLMKYSRKKKLLKKNKKLNIFLNINPKLKKIRFKLKQFKIKTMNPTSPTLENKNPE